MVWITKEMLNKHHACSFQVGLFAQQWPKGVEVSEESVDKAIRLGLNLSWLARRMPRPARRVFHGLMMVPESVYCAAADRASKRFYVAGATEEAEELYNDLMWEPERVYCEAVKRAFIAAAGLIT